MKTELASVGIFAALCRQSSILAIRQFSVYSGLNIFMKNRILPRQRSGVIDVHFTRGVACQDSSAFRTKINLVACSVLLVTQEKITDSQFWIF